MLLFIGENLKNLRKSRDLTQEEVAEVLNVTAQSVSKWERGETYPDIALLPAMANFFETSTDALIGMDKINDFKNKNSIFIKGHELLRKGEYQAAIELYSEALKIFPNDNWIMSELAMSLALQGEKLKDAQELCKRVLSGIANEKVHHTTRAALCFIYQKMGEKEQAQLIAQNLPHVRESRENVIDQLKKNPTPTEINDYLRFIVLGESGEQDILMVSFGLDMVETCTKHGLVEKIGDLRKEKGLEKLPPVRIRDDVAFAPNHVRVRYLANYLLDKKFPNAQAAVAEILDVLRKVEV